MVLTVDIGIASFARNTARNAIGYTVRKGLQPDTYRKLQCFSISHQTSGIRDHGTTQGCSELNNLMT